MFQTSPWRQPYTMIEPDHPGVVLSCEGTKSLKNLGTLVDGYQPVPYNRYFARLGRTGGGIGADRDR